MVLKHCYRIKSRSSTKNFHNHSAFKVNLTILPCIEVVASFFKSVTHLLVLNDSDNRDFIEVKSE